LSPKPNAGSDISICSADNCTILNAETIPSSETSLWSSNNPQLSFTNPNNLSTTVCGLEPGANLIVFTTNDGRCGDKSRDTLTINFEPAPIAVADTVYVPNATKKTMDVLLNDFLPDAYSVTVVEQPVHGILQDMTDGIYSYLPNITYDGQDQFRYKVCNLNCSDACTFAVVTLIVEEQGDCAIPTLFTPNNDGVNDIFVVPCLGTDGRLDNEVSIFNQWGDEVFGAQPYNNNWDGTYNGEDLPAGTYYYVVKFNADGGIKTGFLVLQR
jgi:gliding motility-associated-like protein